MVHAGALGASPEADRNEQDAAKATMTRMRRDMSQFPPRSVIDTGCSGSGEERKFRLATVSLAEVHHHAIREAVAMAGVHQLDEQADVVGAGIVETRATRVEAAGDVDRRIHQLRRQHRIAPDDRQRRGDLLGVRLHRREQVVDRDLPGHQVDPNCVHDTGVVVAHEKRCARVFLSRIVLRQVRPHAQEAGAALPDMRLDFRLGEHPRDQRGAIGLGQRVAGLALQARQTGTCSTGRPRARRGQREQAYSSYEMLQLHS